MANSVKDLKFNELPEELRENVIKAAKVIRDKVYEAMSSDDFDSIRRNEWGYDKVREFLLWFQDGVGNARVYKRGNKFSCMIQITGHVNHVEENPHSETFRKMIKRAYSKSRFGCKELGFTLVSEGECGDPFEGFDLWTTPAVAKELWEEFKDKEEKKIHEIKEDAVVDIPPKVKDVNIDPDPVPETQDGDKVSVGISELPKGLQEVVEHVNSNLRDYTEEAIKYFSQKYTFEGTDVLLNTIGGFTEEANCIGDTILWMENGYIGGSTLLTPPIRITSTEIDGLMESVATRFNEAFEQICPTKHVFLTGDESYAQFEMAYDYDYAGLLWKQIEMNPVYETAAIFPRKQFIKESSEYIFEPILESKEDSLDELSEPLLAIKDKESQDSVNSTEVKKALSVLSKVFSNTALRTISDGWKEMKLELMDSRKNNTKPCFAFKIPSDLYSKDFAARFIRGHERFHGFIRKNPTIVIQANIPAFTTLKKKEDLRSSLRAAVQYYSKGMDELADRIQSEFVKLPEEFKKVMLDSKLYEVVGSSLEQLFLFDKVDLSNPHHMFTVPKKKTTDAVTVMIRALPKKEVDDKSKQKKIISDFKEIFKSFYECGSPNLLHTEFLESLQDLMNGNYKKKMNEYRECYHATLEDPKWITEQTDPQIKYYQEFFGVKKLKKIPSDLVAYISIETEAIRDANDKMMIASYCLSKLEVVEWYIELLETGSKKYVVPHTLPQLNSIRTQLLACYDRIMRVKITPYGDRPILGEIRYPKGYEG